MREDAAHCTVCLSIIGRDWSVLFASNRHQLNPGYPRIESCDSWSYKN